MIISLSSKQHLKGKLATVNVPASPFPLLLSTNQTLYLSFACTMQMLASCGYLSSSIPEHLDVVPDKKAVIILNIYIKISKLNY